MNRLIHAMLCSILTLSLLGAQSDGKMSEKKAPATRRAGSSAVLHPEMTVGNDAGTYDKPMGTLGEKASEPWSATSIDAAVDKKPEPGKAITATGEIIDLSCYLQLGKHGEKHVSCGKKCLQNNQPIGLLTKDGAVYMLMEEEHDPRRDGQTSFRTEATNHLGHIMEVTGTEASHAGIKAIYVQGYVKK